MARALLICFLLFLVCFDSYCFVFCFVFLIWLTGFKGQVRLPKGRPHLAPTLLISFCLVFFCFVFLSFCALSSVLEGTKNSFMP